MLLWESIQQKAEIYRQTLFIKQQKVNSLCTRGANNKIFCSEVLTFTKHFPSDICFGKIRWWTHDPGLPGWNCNPPTRDRITLQLHVEVTFRPGKAGQFSNWYLIRFACIFFFIFLCKHVILQNWRFTGGDYMTQVSRYEILPRFAGIPTVL